MAIQLSGSVRDAMLDSVETTISTTPTLAIFSGSAPANCGTANSGTLLVEMSLPSDWMQAASGGAKSKNGTWEDTAADGSGTAGHFRIFQGSTCHVQGTVGQGSGDLQLDNTLIVSGQQVTITSFTLNMPNA